MRICFFSGGLASAAAAIITRPDVLLFTDTLVEDADLYRFNVDVSAFLGVPITRLVDGRTPWQVFFDERMMGNTRVDPCSRVLKRELAHRWVQANSSEDSDLVFGITFEESHRIRRIKQAWAPRRAIFPLVESDLFKEDARAIVEKVGLRVPRLYCEGFAHNNCAGACVKAGQGQWAHLLRTNPDLYAEWESNEQRFREMVGKDVAILRDRRRVSSGDLDDNGSPLMVDNTRPMTLREFRERIEARDLQPDLFEVGGCGCMVEGED